MHYVFYEATIKQYQESESLPLSCPGDFEGECGSEGRFLVASLP